MTRGPHPQLHRLRLRLGRVACQIFPSSARSPAISRVSNLPTMARLLARTLTLGRPAAPGSSLQPHRTLSDKVELIEIDLSEESASSTSSGDSTEEPMGMGRLNDAIRGVLVRRAAPEWLPFVPGGSYWVPPMRRPLGVSDLVGTVVYNARATVDTAEMAKATMVKAAMTKEEVMCFTTQRGWPSEAYFVQGKVWYPVKKSRKNAKTDDEES